MSTLKRFSRGRGRRYWVVGATLVAAAMFGVTFVASSGAAGSPCPIPGNFEIDGDMNQGTCTPPADDWDTSGIGVQSTTQGGTYSTSGKDDADPTTWTSSGATPNKTDFAQAYATSRVVNGHFFVFVAWERSDTTGTQGYAIEVTNAGSTTGSDGTPQPSRGSGGAVFYLSSQGASAPQFDSACSYTSQSNYGQTCTNSDASVTAAINTAQISDPLNGTDQPAGGFFEVALDVTGLTGVVPSCPGAAANAVYLRSITGQTSNGNLKGYMAPLDVAPNSTCVLPTISTTATPGGSVNATGSAQHDDATVGDGTNFGVGSVKFFLCSPAEVSANGGDCSADGTQVGAAKILDANGNASSDGISGQTTPNDSEAGKYCWRAEFTPSANDHHFLAGSHTNSTSECFSVQASPSIVTTPSETSGSVGDLLNDSATLSDGSNFTGDGTIKFSLYGPNDPTCDGEPAYTETVPADHNGSDYVTSNDSVIADEAGTWNWTASFSGDDNNHSAFSECGEESVVIHGAAIHIAKTADAAKVNVGSGIGFTMTVYNSGDGDARGVQLSDTLPTNAGLSWSIASQGAGWNGSCAISAGVLSCGPATVPAGTTQAASTFTVHIVSGTTAATGGDCPGSGTVDNTGNVTASNDGSDHSSASTCVQALVDLSVTKSGSPNPLTLGEGNITWTIVVTNNGPDADTGVTIADPMPAGNTFVSATSSKGSCTGGAILNCSIGAMAAGESVTITLITTPSTTGNQVNTVTVAGDRPETNTGNNSASATVLVVGPATPPVFCVAVSKVTPKQLFVGRKTTLTIRLTQDGKAVKGVHVRIKGPKLNLRTGASNSKGVITQRVKMKKAGILVFSPLASKRCNTKRLGVTNVFTPPVTG